MRPRKDTCKDEGVPKQATGKTPNRNLRAPDEVWLPALARAEAEGITLTDAMIAFLREYGAGQLPGARVFTFSNWPEAAGWSERHPTALAELGRELDEAAVPLPAESLAIAAWLAATHHQNDPAQQRRVITGHILRRAMDVKRGGWRERYRDTRHLSETVRALLDRHLPLAPDADN
jgi:hypothetical protein